MFHVILDKQSNAYVSSGARNAIGVTPLLYLARWFTSPLRAVEFLDACGFGKERASRFEIRKEARCESDLRSDQTVVQPEPRERGRPRIRKAPL